MVFLMTDDWWPFISSLSSIISFLSFPPYWFNFFPFHQFHLFLLYLLVCHFFHFRNFFSWFPFVRSYLQSFSDLFSYTSMKFYNYDPHDDDDDDDQHWVGMYDTHSRCFSPLPPFFFLEKHSLPHHHHHHYILLFSSGRLNWFFRQNDINGKKWEIITRKIIFWKYSPGADNHCQLAARI